MYKVAIDNGHGINTPGKRTPKMPNGRVIKEWEFNHPTAKKLEQVLKRCGLDTVMVSDTKEDTPLAVRTDRANNAKADVFVSIHYNAYKGIWGDHGGIETVTYKDPLVTSTLRRGSNGTQVARLQTILKGLGYNVGSIDGSFGPKTYSAVTKFQRDNKLAVDGIVGPATRATLFPKHKDKKLAKLVLDELVKDSGLRNRGVKEGNFYVLRYTVMPAIICECGFMDNLEEAKLMLDESYQEKIAEATCRGICNYLGVKYIPNNTPEPKPAQKTNTNGLYRVQVGAFANKTNAERLSDELKEKGYNTYIVKEG